MAISRAASAQRAREQFHGALVREPRGRAVVMRRVALAIESVACARVDVDFGPGLACAVRGDGVRRDRRRSEEHTSELQSLMRISYAVFCLKKKTQNTKNN